MNSCDQIIYRRDGGVLTLSLNRPHKKNALTGDMYRALTELLNKASNDKNTNVVLITAEGDYFCAGNDVNGFKLIADIPYQQRPGFNFMNTLAGVSKPVIAALPGDAVGIGVTMLLHCDLVFLSESSRLKLPFVGIGLVPEFSSTTLLVQRLGYQRAAELLLVRQRLSASQAKDLGLATEVVSREQLLPTAIDSALAICQQSSEAVQHTKRLMKQPTLDATLHQIEQETLAINGLLGDLSLPIQDNKQ
ncbi:MAG: enoyl-CoA hydratase [Cellvibrionaceae bacterium]|nr:enoyl-CoA hydratase [Cellvibrionaceae bacterium]